MTLLKLQNRQLPRPLASFREMLACSIRRLQCLSASGLEHRHTNTPIFRALDRCKEVLHITHGAFEIADQLNSDTPSSLHQIESLKRLKASYVYLCSPLPVDGAWLAQQPKKCTQVLAGALHIANDNLKPNLLPRPDPGLLSPALPVRNQNGGEDCGDTSYRLNPCRSILGAPVEPHHPDQEKQSQHYRHWREHEELPIFPQPKTYFLKLHPCVPHPAKERSLPAFTKAVHCNAADTPRGLVRLKRLTSRPSRGENMSDSRQLFAGVSSSQLAELRVNEINHSYTGLVVIVQSPHIPHFSIACYLPVIQPGDDTCTEGCSDLQFPKEVDSLRAKLGNWQGLQRFYVRGPFKVVAKLNVLIDGYLAEISNSVTQNFTQATYIDAKIPCKEQEYFAPTLLIFFAPRIFMHIRKRSSTTYCEKRSRQLNPIIHAYLAPGHIPVRSHRHAYNRSVCRYQPRAPLPPASPFVTPLHPELPYDSRPPARLQAPRQDIQRGAA